MTVAGLLLAMLWIGIDVPAADSVDEVRVAFDRSLKQLDSPVLAERSRAEQELKELGPKILPWFPAPELLPSASAREAVKRLRYQLQQKLARDSARPAHVTLSGKFTLPELLTEISQQTGNPVRVSSIVREELQSPRAWTFQDVCFWEAIEQICQTLPLRTSFQPEVQDLWLTMREKQTDPGYVSQSGVLRLEYAEAQRLSITGDPNHQLIRVQGELMLEPRLRPLFIHFRSADFVTKREAELTLENWNPLARYELPMAGASRRTKIQWDFVTPTESVPQSISVQGKVIVHLAAATEQIRFDHLSAQQEILRRRGGVSVRMQPVDWSDDAAETRSAKVRITVSYETGGPAFESHRTWVYHNAAWMEDGPRRFPLTDFDTLQQADGNVQMEYRFQNLPKSETLQFVYEAPTLLLDIPFELNLPRIPVSEKTP